MSRYVLLHDSIWESGQFKKEPFTQREAFMWMVSRASWKDHTTYYGHHQYDLKRGQFVCSYREMGKVWRWDKAKVDRFLKNQRFCGGIKTETTTRQKATLITICNYDKYQVSQDKGKTQNETRTRQGRDKDETHNIQGYTGDTGKEDNPPIVPPKGKPKRKTMLDPDFPLTTERINYAHAQGIRDIKGEFEQFKNHHIGKQNLWADWNRAWQTWCRNSVTRFGGGARASPANRPSKVDDIMEARRERERRRNV